MSAREDRPEVAVVTGAGRGIGAAVADLLADRDWVVVGLDRMPLADWETRSSGVVRVEGDVASTTDLERAIARVTELGVLTGWVNNAAVIEDTPLHDTTDEGWSRIIDVNLGGVAKGCRAAVSTFLSQKRAGAIVNVSSIHGRGAFPGNPAYDSSKGGVEALTRYVAVEYGHLGIRANAVAPGAVATSMLRGVIDRNEDPAGKERDFARLHPAGRLATPQDVAKVTGFLLSDEASFVSGAVIPVDGGAAARVYPYPPHPMVPRDLAPDRT